MFRQQAEHYGPDTPTSTLSSTINTTKLKTPISEPRRELVQPHGRARLAGRRDPTARRPRQDRRTAPREVDAVRRVGDDVHRAREERVGVGQAIELAPEAAAAPASDRRVMALA